MRKENISFEFFPWLDVLIYQWR